MLRILGITVLVVTLTGCMQKWEHTSKRLSEFYADDRECQLIVGGAYQSVEPGRGESQSYEHCMWERGWRKKNTIWFFDPKPHQ